jgi:hypothetical protein
VAAIPRPVGPEVTGPRFLHDDQHGRYQHGRHCRHPHAPSTVWQILTDAGIDPAPERTSDSWPAFLRSQAEAILAADFFETATLTGTRMHILAVIEHASRRIRILGTTANPTADWVTQAVRNLAMDLSDAGCAPGSSSATGTASTRPCSTPSSPTPASRSC